VDGGYRGGRGGRRWEQGWAVAQWCSEVTTALPRPWVADGGQTGLKGAKLERSGRKKMRVGRVTLDATETKR
jgi:hypothetical protein